MKLQPYYNVTNVSFNKDSIWLNVYFIAQYQIVKWVGFPLDQLACLVKKMFASSAMTCSEEQCATHQSNGKLYIKPSAYIKEVHCHLEIFEVPHTNDIRMS